MNRRSFVRNLVAVGISGSVVSMISCRILGPIENPNRKIRKSGAGSLRLASDPRQAIVLECFYALDPSYYGRSSRMINNCHVSDWNYLATDRNAFTKMRQFFDALCTVPSTGNKYPCPGISSVMPSFFTAMQSDGMYAAPTAYGLQNYGSVGAVGRGGQCRFFANLILFRSETYWDNNRRLYSYQTYINDFTDPVTKKAGPRTMTKPIGQVQVGDVIQTNYANGHTAIVVQIMSRDAAGNASSVDVIDSNWVGGIDNEVIGRHVISSLGSYIALKLNFR